MRGTVTSLLLCAAVVTTLWPAISASPSAVPMSPAPLPHPAATWVPGGTVNVPVVCGDHVYQDYRSNGTLTFSLGPGILHCDITLRVLGTYVYDGALVVQVQGLTVFTGSLRVFVEDNQQLDGGLLVVVRDNQIHPANPEVSLPYDLEVNVRRNGGGGTANDNRVIGGPLAVQVVNNFVKNVFIVDVSRNYCAKDYDLGVQANNVNFLFIDILGNHACGALKVAIESNHADDSSHVLMLQNRAYDLVDVKIKKNDIGWPEPWFVGDFDVDFFDNHAAGGRVVFFYQDNVVKGTLSMDLGANGSADRIHFVVTDNREAGFTLQIDFLKAGLTIYVKVARNNAPATYSAQGNVACKAEPTLLIEGHGSKKNNLKYCTYDDTTDPDHDGLGTQFERMLGLDPADEDTDDDGLYDGWRDRNGNGRRDSQEEFGELGNPRSQGQGGVATLFAGPAKEGPHPLCKDVYVEVDFMKQERAAGEPPHQLVQGAVKPVVEAFARRAIRLHVDLGWAIGAGQTTRNGGGEKMTHVAPLPISARGIVFTSFCFKNGESVTDVNGDGFQEPRHFNTLRKGSFRYAVIAHNGSNPAGLGVSERVGGDDMIIYEGTISKARGAGAAGGTAAVFMHELGHLLGLDHHPTGGAGPLSYRSRMNYRYPALLRFSDGLFGGGDVDDWKAMSLDSGLLNWDTHDTSC